MYRTLASLALMTVVLGCGPADGMQFDRIDRTFRDVRTVVETKADLAGFQKAVDAYATAVDTGLADVGSSRERAALDRYKEIGGSLKDIVLMWEEKNARGQELLPLSAPLPARLQKQYDLPVNTNEPPSIYATEAMQMIWDAAKKRMEEPRE